MSCRTLGRRVRVLALALALGSPAAHAAVWTDALGRRVEVPDRPQRIVSLVPSVTEVLYALGVQDRVAGVTRFCTFPAEARSKPKVGGYADASLEAVVALASDLVLASADATPPVLIDRLAGLGIPVYVVYPRSLSGTAAMLRRLGRVVGAARAGERLAADLERATAGVRSRVRDLPRPGVLLCVMVEPLVVAGPGTLAHDLIETAGGRNVVPAGPSRYPTWGPESLLAADPDVVVVSPHPGQPAPGRLFDRWPELKAVAAGRVVEIPADWIHRPGLRLARGLRALARAIHPGAFPEESP
ncbi:ABC transporter substrate-binding protein [Deferrisoma sp.]